MSLTDVSTAPEILLAMAEFPRVVLGIHTVAFKGLLEKEQICFQLTNSVPLIAACHFPSGWLNYTFFMSPLPYSLLVERVSASISTKDCLVCPLSCAKNVLFFNASQEKRGTVFSAFYSYFHKTAQSPLKSCNHFLNVFSDHLWWSDAQSTCIIIFKLWQKWN